MDDKPEFLLFLFIPIHYSFLGIHNAGCLGLAHLHSGTYRNNLLV